ncbi:uroporphyrinogen-III synthase [Streptomyces californicus]
MQDDDTAHGPLAGFTVGVTAARRAEELGALLRRRGATVLHAPALRIVPLADDRELLTATQDLIDHAPDVALATTAIGFRGWIEAADGWGIGDALLKTLRAAELLARGPKVKGAVRAAGLTEAWSPGSESMAEVLDRLLAEGVAGRRIALQLHGEPLPGFVESLTAAGAEVVVVPVYRWMPPQDIAPLDRMLDVTAARGLDARHLHQRPRRRLVPGPRRDARTAPGGARGAARRHRGRLRRTRHRPSAPGPEHPDPPAGTLPPRPPRPAPLRRLPSTARVLPIGGHRVEIRGHAVLVDDELRAVPPAGMALLHVLARRPGWVVARADLLRALPGSGTDEHAVETAMARARSALGAPRLIQTVVKRGYRLALDPSADTKYGR